MKSANVPQVWRTVNFRPNFYFCVYLVGQLTAPIGIGVGESAQSAANGKF